MCVKYWIYGTECSALAHAALLQICKHFTSSMHTVELCLFDSMLRLLPIFPTYQNIHGI